MPSLVEKMQPWTQTHNFIRRSWSSSSTSSSTPLTSSSSTSSLLSTGGSASGSNSGGSDIMAKNGSTRAGGVTGSSSLFGKFCSANSSSSKHNSSSSSNSKSNCGSSSNNNSGSNNNNSIVCNGSRPKRKTPILSTCMSNWVKFDHDCQKPLPCSQCEINQEHNRKVLFTSGGNVLISTGNSGKGRHHHHRHSQNSFGDSSSHTHHLHHLNGVSLSEPTSPTDCGGVVSRSSSAGGSHNNNAFPGEVVSWENVKNKSSFKIVINVPCLDMNLFQNENIQVEIVCNKNKLGTGKDLETVQRTRAELKSSGWYWEGINSEASMEILESTKPGAFIVRDSADPRFLYSISIQTERGPTSVRLPYRNGKFSLDGDEKLVDRVPKFDSVIGLIEHYVNGEGAKIGKQVSVWIDHEGNMHSAVKLTKPVRRDVGSLKHLARVAINRHNLINNNNSSNSSTATTCSTSTNNTNSTSISSTATTSGNFRMKKVNSSTSATSANGPASVDVAVVDDSSKNITSVPKKENTISASSSSSSSSCSTAATVIAPVADLSKLPLSLQTYMLEYPYKL